jgi:hypothetical protein
MQNPGAAAAAAAGSHMPLQEGKYIREVWADNLESEMAILRDLVEHYPYLAMVGSNISSIPM